MRQPALQHIQEGEPNSPQARDVASLEPLAQCGDTLGGKVTAVPSLDTTEPIVIQTATADSPGIQSVILGSYSIHIAFFGMCVGSWELLT